MKIENFDSLVKKLEQRGWGHLAPELEEKMKTGEAELSLHVIREIEGVEVDYESKFRKHREHDHYFFNHINATLVQDGEVVAQAAFRESWKLDPDQMQRILEYGSKVAVYKEGLWNKEGERFNAYITVNADEPLNENGMLNLNTYHDNYYSNYPFVLDDALVKLPFEIRELVPENIEGIKSQLVNGVPVPVTIVSSGEEAEGFLAINAKIGRVDVLGTDLEPIQLSKGKQQANAKNTTAGTKASADSPPRDKDGQQDQSAEKADNEKKKPWQNRQPAMKWNRNKQGKGVPR